MAGHYSVDSFHINVGVGDSAIHLLVQDPIADTLPGPSTKPKVLRATLIDGGMPSSATAVKRTSAGTATAGTAKTGAYQSIREAIQEIKKRYDLGERGSTDPGDGYMRFDSIVVSHWDQDHYGGITSLIRADLQDHLDNLPATTTDWKGELENASSRYCLYTTPVGKSSGLRTTFYAPYWNVRYTPLSPKQKEVMERTIADGTWVPGVTVGYDNPKQLRIQIGSPSTLTFADTFTRGRVTITDAEIKNLCSIRCEPQEVLGANILDNRNLGTTPFSGIDTATTLTGIHNGTALEAPGTDPAPVGIYCIAAHGYILGKPASLMTTTPEFIVKEKNTATNQASIANLVIWHRPNIEVSHYFAGDAWYEVEMAVMAWIRADPSTRRRVTNIKLSHHGAQSSTPIEMLDGVDAFDPENIIISAGDKHYHPSWLILFYLNAWMIVKEKRPGAVYATRYPVYGNKSVPAPTPRKKTQMFHHWDYLKDDTKVDAKLKEAWDALDKLYKTFGPPGSTPWIPPHEQGADWYGRITLPAMQTAQDTPRWFVDQVFKAWTNNLSLLDGPEVTSGGMPNFDVKEVVTTRKVRYIRVRSEQTDAAAAVTHGIGVLYDAKSSRPGAVAGELECAERGTWSAAASRSTKSKVKPTKAPTGYQLYPDYNWGIICPPLPAGFKRPMAAVAHVGADLGSPAVVEEISDSASLESKSPQQGTVLGETADVIDSVTPDLTPRGSKGHSGNSEPDITEEVMDATVVEVPADSSGTSEHDISHVMSTSEQDSEHVMSTAVSPDVIIKLPSVKAGIFDHDTGHAATKESHPTEVAQTPEADSHGRERASADVRVSGDHDDAARGVSTGKEAVVSGTNTSRGPEASPSTIGNSDTIDKSIAREPLDARQDTEDGVPLRPIPIIPIPFLPGDPPPPPPPSVWMSTVADTDANTIVVTDPTLQSFILTLHLRCFGLQARPESKKQTAFIADEEWNCWFADVLDTPAPMEMVADDGLQPQAFNFSMTLLEKNTLTFGTEQIYKAYNIDKAKQPALGLPNGNCLMFGLNTDSAPSVTATLTDLLTFSHQDQLVSNPLIATLGSALPLHLATQDGSRNAVWFQPAQAYRVTQRLQWVVPTDAINSFFSDCGVKIELRDTAIITRRSTSWQPGPKMVATGSISFRSTVSIGSSSKLELTAAIGLSESGLSITVTANKSAWTEFVDWFTGILKEAVGDMTLISDVLTELGSFIGSFFAPRQLYLTFYRSDTKAALRCWSIDVEISLKSVPILVSYDSTSKILRGQLWLVSTDSRLFLPDYEDNLDLMPLTSSYTSPLKLTDLSDSIKEGDLPRGIPNAIERAQVLIDTENKGISFAASIVCVLPKSDAGNVPPIVLDRVDLAAAYTKADGVSIMLDFVVTLGGQPDQSSAGDAIAEIDDHDEDDANYGDEDTGATITGVISYESKGNAWHLYGSIEALRFDEIYDLFEPGAQDDISAMLSHFWIANLEIDYTYGSGGKGTQFDIAGTLLLGPLRLDMRYHYDTETGWVVKADLGTIEDKKYTLGDVIDDLTANHGDDGDVLPDFILGIPLTTGSKDKIITVRCAKHAKATGQPTTPDTPRSESYLLFQAEVHIGIFTVGFTHYRDLSGPAGQPLPPKRVFKLYMNGIPAVNVPTLGPLPQPFDEIAFVYIQDKATDVTKSLVPGLTADDVKIINDGMRDAKGGEGGDWLMFRDTRKPNAGSGDTVMPAGAHFIIIMKSGNDRKAILDYTMGRNKKKQPQTNAEKTLALAAAGNGGQGGKSSMASMKKTVGPIKIENIGLKCQNGELSVLLDASFLLGPVGFTFIGAKIGIRPGKNILKDFTLDDVSFGLSGLAVAFDQPPVRIGGIFVYKDEDLIKYFAGGIVVGVDPYQFIAAGMYGHVKKPTEYDTAFVFAKLEGPLITLEFAEISGITGGFGYNSDIKLPTIETVRQFPFLSGAVDASGGLLDFLGNLVKIDGTFSPKENAMWLAAGLKVDALEMIAIDAVFVLSWNPSVSIGIFGVGTANIPKTSRGGRTFAHVELGILAVIDFGAGVFKVEMQLAPSSYVFDPSCRLTGGFALYYWFNDKVPDRKGEWVFTIGGFHRSFQRPSYYPNPPRLGIQWKVSDAISIVGEAYFAVTPKSCMGGGRLQATLTAGPLRAWFSAWADFLINYMPFDFTGQVGVSVGISCKVDLLITSFTVSTSIGAQLDLLGPPLRGRVKVDFWVMSFHVNFGPDVSRGEPPNLEDFYNMVIQAGDPQSAAASFLTGAAPTKSQVAATDEKKTHVFTCRGGMLEDDRKLDKVETEESEVWRVKANEFVFAIDCRFALTEATITLPNEYGEPKDLDPYKYKAGDELYAKPMQLVDNVTSKLEVDIQPDPDILMSMEKEEDRQADENWRVIPIIKEVPAALWGQYDPSENPRKTGNNNIGSLLNGNKGTLTRCMGLQIQPPKPFLADDKIGVFDAIEAMKQNVFGQGKSPRFVGYENGNTDLYPEKGGNTPYEHVQDLWRADYGTKREDILDALWDGLGWDSTKGRTKTKDDDTPPQKLTAATPVRLVDALGSMYMAPPQVTVG